MSIEDSLANALFPNNPEKKDELRKNLEYWDKQHQPLIDELERSLTTSARDYSVIVY